MIVLFLSGSRRSDLIKRRVYCLRNYIYTRSKSVFENEIAAQLAGTHEK